MNPKRTLFAPEHELYRDMVARFIAERITPHHEQWEHEGMVPRELWRQAGQAGLLLPSTPESYGGGGAISAHAGRGGGDRPRAGHRRDRLHHPFRYRGAVPAQFRHRGPEAAASAGHGARRHGGLAGDHGARRGQRRQGHPQHGGPRRRRLSAQRPEDLHHQRLSRRPRAGGGQDRSGGRRARHQPVLGGRGHAGLHARPAAGQRSASAPRTPPSCSSRTCWCPTRTCWASRGRALAT